MHGFIAPKVATEDSRWAERLTSKLLLDRPNAPDAPLTDSVDDIPKMPLRLGMQNPTNSYKEAFADGASSAKLTSTRQASLTLAFDGGLLAFLIWGPWRWYYRLPIVIVARLIYGVFASARRLRVSRAAPPE